MRSDPLLTISDLCIGFGGQPLVENIGLQIGRGEIFGLVGESGSGKTLTALSVLGLLPRKIGITSGKILLADQQGTTDLSVLGEREMNRVRGNRISMIFQEPMTSLNPSLRCGFQAREPLMLHRQVSGKEAKLQLLELFGEVGLPDPERIYRAWPHELSGGQRQRVMIAQALTTGPELLIADEPTTALDVTVQKRILDLLLTLREKYRLSILFISHDLSVIKLISDHVAVMEKGRIVEQGQAKRIMEHPSEPYTKGLIACKPSLDSQPHRLPTVRDFVEGKPPPADIQPRATHPREKAEPLVSITGLEVAFRITRKKSVRAIQHVSLEIHRGETLGLVGESGSGKTTLGRSILGLVDAQNGRIMYGGTPLSELPEKAFRRFRRKLQIVFQDPYSSLNPGMTVGNIIGEPLRVHRLVSGRGNIRKECIQLLDRVGLPVTAMQKYPHEFSGGQRQRIGIARALACRPEFIVLDESVSALDVSIQAQVLNLLNDLKEEFNLTYLFISHDLTVVRYMSDRIMVMKDGQIIESGASDELYRNPVDPYTMELIEAIPD